MTRPTDLLQGTLDLLILKTLSWGPAHGYAVARWIEQRTGAVLHVGEAALYSELHRLEERCWLASRMPRCTRRRPFALETPNVRAHGDSLRGARDRRHGLDPLGHLRSTHSPAPVRERAAADCRLRREPRSRLPRRQHLLARLPLLAGGHPDPRVVRHVDVDDVDALRRRERGRARCRRLGNGEPVPDARRSPGPRAPPHRR